MQILHVSADYPDAIIGAKTRAVSNLLALTAECDHRVYSINRVNWGSSIDAAAFGDAAGADHRALVYGAPPKGLFLERYLDRLADWIAEDVARRGLKPDLVHAHKLSIEGLVGARLAARVGAPLMVSVQGNSDAMIIGIKRRLRPRWRAIWTQAAVVFPFAPWAAARLDALLGPRLGAVRLLPCPTPSDALIAPRMTGPAFTTAFNLAHYKNKNAERLIRAAARAARTVPDLQLGIVGGGDAIAFATLARLIDRVAPGKARLLGAMPHERMQSLFNASCAFAMASHRESYGMVLAESLLAGSPCLFSRGRAIDGYFEDGGVALAVDPGDEAEMAGALERLAREEETFKTRLAALQRNGGLEIIRRVSITETYRAGVAEAYGSKDSPRDIWRNT